MYTIILVDDEKLVLETLEQYVNWKAMDISVVGIASNGKEALLKLSELHPDIVLVDVRMPIMDGLEFARRAKQIDKHVKIVFLSGHNEFQYIKAALNAEAVGYLLKPLDLEELGGLMERVKKKCEEDQIANQSEEWIVEKLALRLLNSTNEEQRKECIHRLAKTQFGFPDSSEFAAAVVSIDPIATSTCLRNGMQGYTINATVDWIQLLRSELYNPFGRIISVEAAPNVFGLWVRVTPQLRETIMSRSFWQQVRQRLIENTNSSVTIGVSSPEQGLERFPGIFISAKQANEFKFYKNTGNVFMPHDIYETVLLHIDIEPDAAELLQYIKNENEQQIETLITLFIDMLSVERVRKDQAIHAIIRMLTAIEQEFSYLLAATDRELLFKDHWKEIMSMVSLEHIQAYMIHYCSAIVSALKERNKTSHLHIVDQIIQIFEERYHLNITLDDIAKEIFLSPNYVRTLFKEKTGETILGYLTRVRMHHASELLKDKSLKIHIIAHAVGYENVSYFCSVFHKYKGCTPNTYRKAYL
jgi:two-component system, response regulator YesN